MKHNIILYGLSAATLLSGISPAQSAVTCTATPDCATLGYTKTASDCPDGGVKCPFNSSKMFCLKKGGGVEFSLKNKINNLDIVFSDGTSSAKNVAGKIPIGVALVTETNSAYNHGVIFQINQPPISTRAEAIKYCQNYITNGTTEGDWKLPTHYEMMYLMGWDSSESKTEDNQLNDINYKLQTILGADRMGYSCGYFIGYISSSSYSCPNYLRSPSNSVTTSCNLNSKRYYIYNTNYSTYSSSSSSYCASGFQFWLTDETQNAAAYYVPNLSSSGSNQASKLYTNTNKSYHSFFRCVIRF